MKETDVLEALQNQQSWALEMVMKRYSPYLSSIVWGIVQDRLAKEDAEEVVADVFVALWNQARSIQPEALRPWLASVARHKAINALKGAGFSINLEEDWLEIPDTTDLEVEAQKKECSRLVRQAVCSMDMPDREIFLLHYFYIQSVREISQRTGMSENTIKSRLRRGRLQLKDILQKWGAV